MGRKYTKLNRHRTGVEYAFAELKQSQNIISLAAYAVTHLTTGNNMRGA